MISEKEFLNLAPTPKAPTKEDLQIKKLQLQIEQLEAKKQATYKKKSSNALLALTLILIAPIAILGGFLIAAAKASGGTRRGRRY